MSSIAEGGVHLRSLLAPLAEPLARADVTDIYVNRPGEVWIESLGGRVERQLVPTLTEAALVRLSRQVAALTHQGISREHPLLAATLPGGERIQIVGPPATRDGTVLAIRKHSAAELSLEELANAGTFEGATAGPDERGGPDEQIWELLRAHQFAAALRAAVRARQTIVVCGGTGTGKTTLLNALVREIPGDERLVLIEDTPEVRLIHENAIGLLTARSELSEASVSAAALVTASMRLRPDRIILGELRGGEALAFLRTVKSGHPGSLTTLHANSAEGALEQIALLAQEGGSNLPVDRAIAYARSAIDLVVQLVNQGGRRRVARITPFHPPATLQR